MEDIIAILKSDTTLKTLIGRNIKALGTEGINECIVYEFSPVSNNKIKREDRLSITTIAYSQLKSMQILDRVSELLLTLGDTQLNDDILNVVQNGGGYLSNTLTTGTMHHFKAYYYITRRV